MRENRIRTIWKAGGAVVNGWLAIPTAFSAETMAHQGDPEILRRTVVAAGGTLRNAIMIGDSLTDIRTARAAGVPVIAVDFGYTDRPVSEFGPDRIISRFAQLPAAVTEIRAAN